MSKENAKKKFIKALQEGGRNEDVINAFASVEQEIFIPKTVGMEYYDMNALPIGFGEKSDDPMLLAEMIEILSPDKSWRLLEVGSGSGYSSAILSHFVNELVSVEYNERLAKTAKDNLVNNGYYNIRVFAGDASEVMESLGYFDAVIVFASCIQRPMKFLSVLKPNRFAVFPMGPAIQQQIVKYKNTSIGDEDTLKNFTFHRFCNVSPIRGEYGWLDQVDLNDEEELSEY